MVWQDRAVNGPYKTAGDVSTNSPGDWDRIVTNKSSFMSNQTGDRWSGQTTNVCWTVSQPDVGQSRGINLLCAAFYSLVQSDSTVRTAVRDELVAQSTTAGTIFTNTTRWCQTGFDGFIHDYASWLIRLLFAYDYIRSNLSGADQTTLDTWFHDAGTYFDDNVNYFVTQNRFPNRNTDDYTTFAAGWSNDASVGPNPIILWFGGPTRGDWHEGWNNRNASLATFAGLCGIMFNDTTLKNRAKRYFKEWMTYSVFYTSGVDTADSQDIHRGISDGDPGVAFAYGLDTPASMVVLADAFARNGDTELYDYSTSSGIKGTSGGPKTIQKVTSTAMAYVPDGILVRYSTTSSGNQNSTYKIGPTDTFPTPDTFRVQDIFGAQANLFMRDTTVAGRYQRTEANSPAYPSSITGFWEGPRGRFPGMLFMFGQMENNSANPYV